MKTLTAGDLRKALVGLDDNAPVLVSGGQDHTFRVPYTATATSAGYYAPCGTYYQWHGKEYAGDSVREIQVLILE